MPSTSVDDLIRGLNEDLRGEFQAVIMYRLYASMVQGPYRQELRSFFAAEIPEELGHAQILADKISAYFQSGRPLSVEELRTTAFPSQRGGYNEAQVDVVIDDVIEVMLAVR